ncbi:endonuclease domain-containing 1 protein-like [Centroberyx affinis]|uniref:endonuclease domain-containing 1 protein-like n=1 Tax=Centroberyx affinis TaxID=166261 RepID=UPI003A5C23AD
MVSVKTWGFLSLAALLVSVVPTVTEVVRSMSECAGFLLEETPPHIPGVLENGTIKNQTRYKPVCQTFNNTRRFVTLYDTDNKIPVFSAYKFTGSTGSRPSPPWKIEPQLENERDNKNMKNVIKSRVYNHQAGDKDYRNNNRSLDRGHIFPSSHAFDTSDKFSTFTLTNIVPQAETFNKKSWNRTESCVKCVLEKYCINQNNNPEAFVVTGATPSASNFLNNRVNIPSMLWSAFCCYSTKTNKWLASAHWGDNVPDEDNNKYLQTKTLAQLRERLSLEVFPKTQCPLDSTVRDFYSKTNAENTERERASCVSAKTVTI